jgi:hypothetical protein
MVKKTKYIMGLMGWKTIHIMWLLGRKTIYNIVANEWENNIHIVANR